MKMSRGKISSSEGFYYNDTMKRFQREQKRGENLFFLLFPQWLELNLLLLAICAFLLIRTHIDRLRGRGINGLFLLTLLSI